MQLLVSPTKRSQLIASLDYFVTKCSDDVQAILGWLPTHDSIVAMTTKELENLTDSISDNLGSQPEERITKVFALNGPWYDNAMGTQWPAYLFDLAEAA